MIGLAPVGLALAAMGIALLAVGLHGVLWIDILSVNVPPGYWELGPLRFDLTDLAVVVAITGLLVRRVGWVEVTRIPYLGLWLALGTLISISYLVAPINQRYLGAPHETLYQLFRYCWQQILFYPLVMLLLADPKRMNGTFAWITIAAVLLAFQAIPEGYLGTRFRAVGPFSSGNALGGALAPALVVCAGLALRPGRSSVRLLSLLSGLLVLRALTFTGSRGAMAAAALGLVALLFQLLPIQALRSRIFETVAGALVVLLLLLSVNPSLLADAPSLSRFWGAGGNSQSTLEWRIQERWPHFAKIASENPWLGVGSDVDPSLGGSGATPHNGFLSIAVTYGIPVAALFLCFAFLALRGAFRALRGGVPPPYRFLTGVSASALISLLLHNGIDSILMLEFGARYFWIFVAFCVAVERARISVAEHADSAPVLEEHPAPGSVT